MEPHQKMYHLFHVLLRKLFIYVGHDIFRPGKFMPYGLTYFMYFLLVIFFSGAIKTMAFYNMNIVLNMIAFVGIAFEVTFQSVSVKINELFVFYYILFLLSFFSQLVAKMTSVMYGKVLVTAMDQITFIYAANAKTTDRKRLMLLSNFSLITEIVLKAGSALYCCAGLFYILNPFYSYYFKNELIPLIPLYIPFIDEETKTGFITLCGIHFGFMILTVMATACTDFMFVMIIVNIPVLSTIFCDNVRELNDILKNKNVDVPAAKGKLRNILLMHRDIWE